MDSIFSWGILVVSMIFGFISVFKDGEKEKEQYRSENDAFFAGK